MMTMLSALAPLLLTAAAAGDADAPTRVAVPDLERAGVEGRQARVVQLALVQELRKLEGLSVLGADEVRAMLSHEADKQLIGCTEGSCLGELADALGVDDLVVAAVLRDDDGGSAISLKRIRQREARVVASFDRRFEEGNGEELLVALGPGVATLFPDRPLRAGAERGPAKEMALRLNPPPLPTWLFASGASATAVLAVGGIVTAAANAGALAELEAYKHGTVDHDVATAKADVADGYAYASYALVGAAAAGAVATVVAGAFTDFGGYAELNEEAAR